MVANGRGVASREVKLLLDLLNVRSVVIGGPSWRIQVGSWFGVWGWRGLGWAQRPWESHLREMATDASERPSPPRERAEGRERPGTGVPGARLRNASPLTCFGGWRGWKS